MIHEETTLTWCIKSGETIKKNITKDAEQNYSIELKDDERQDKKKRVANV